MSKAIISAIILISMFSMTGYGVLNNALISCGDDCLVYGPGTDTAFDSAEGIARIMKLWKARGYTGVYWRSDITDLDPNVYIRFHGSPLEPLIDLGIRRGVEDTAAKLHVLQVAREAAEAEGLQFWVYYCEVYSDGAPPWVVQPGYMPWSFCHKYVYDHPEVLTIDRHGKIQYLVREYAYPGARAEKVQDFVYMAKKWGIKNFLASMRTEAAQTEPGPVKADQYGFNTPVVNDMLSLYGVNILTDPRFDINNPAFSSTDTMVENWHNLRGGYLTQFYRDLRAGLNAVDPNIRISVQVPGDYVGPDLGNWKVDWRTWINEGLVNELVQPVSCQGGWDSTSGKGYLCDPLRGIGTLPSTTYKSYISSSAHPETKLLNGGGYERFSPRSLPSGCDGWQTFWTLEAFDIAWHQRWEQWNRDLRDFGYIKFIEQNFDTWTPYSSGYTGAEGDARYHPELRACPGGWFSLGDGSDSLPVVQNIVRHGDMGNALKFKRSSSGSCSIKVFHSGGYDHSSFQTRVDNIIDNGTCTFDFWAYRQDENSSITLFLQYSHYTDSGLSVGINIGSGNGGEEEAPVQVWGYSHWFNTIYWMPFGIWQKFTLAVDVDNKKYTVYAGPNRDMTLMTNMPYTTNINYFDRITISPGNPAGNVCYIDDVSMKWTPKRYYTADRKYIYLQDDFESVTPHDTVWNKAPVVGGTWNVNPPTAATSFYAENMLSFPEGYNSLAAAVNYGAYLYSSDTSKLTLDPNYTVTVDFDLYLRSGYQSLITLQKDHGSSVTAAVNPNVKWKCWNSSAYAVTDANVSYDIWNHVQMVLNCAARNYQVILQPCGSMPKLLGTYSWDSGTQTGDSVFLAIKPQGTNGSTAYFDNVKITYGPVCPAGDYNNDCKVNFQDFAILAMNWLAYSSVGDMSNNGFVDLIDIQNFASNWLLAK